jgi:MFS family permease
MGRRGALVRTNLLSAVAWLFMSLNYSVYFLYLGRLLCGVCAGCNLVLIPTYVAEVSHASMRGLMGTLTQVGLIFPL